MKITSDHVPLSDATLPRRDDVGPSFVSIDGVEHQRDVVVAGSGDVPRECETVALGEATLGDELTTRHRRRLERARAALGGHATHATLLLYGERVDDALVQRAAGRDDVESGDVRRLYTGD